MWKEIMMMMDDDDDSNNNHKYILKIIWSIKVRQDFYVLMQFPQLI